MKNKLCFITGSRAEYGLLRPIIKLCRADKSFRTQIIASGMHLLKEFGFTYRQIEQDFGIDRKVSLGRLGANDANMSEAVGKGIIEFSKAYKVLKPDCVIVLGDRFETLAAAVSAFLLKIPIVHIHGGEITEGAIDDGIRHAITKLSSLHFVSTAAYMKRVIQMGEQPSSVFNVGSLGVENIRKLKLLSRIEISKLLGMGSDDTYLVVTFHPVTMESDGGLGQFKNLLSALQCFERAKVVFTKPNADPLGLTFIEMIDSFVYTNRHRSTVFTSLGTINYLSAMRHAAAVVGNSSSGIIEAPSLHIPTVNIGNRQKGRIRAASVLDSPANAAGILRSLDLALSARFRNKCMKVRNPYERKNTSAKIFSVIKRKLRSILNPSKSFYDIGRN